MKNVSFGNICDRYKWYIKGDPKNVGGILKS